MASKRPPNRVHTLPSGIEVAFWDKIGVDGEPQQRRYRVGGVDGEKYPSVSTIAGIFDKPGLTPAAVKLQEQGVVSLAQMGIDVAALDQEELRTALIEHGLHYDSVWQVARDRGDVAHDMLLELVSNRKVPKLNQYPADIRPWLSGGMKWALHNKPEVIDAEYLVASTEHGFAGRGDLLCRLQDGRLARVDYKTVTEWKYQRGKLLPPYDENLIALAGYELGAVESGYQPSDVRLIVRLGPDGEYHVTESHATEDVFLAALTAYKERKYLTTGRPEVAA